MNLQQAAPMADRGAGRALGAELRHLGWDPKPWGTSGGLRFQVAALNKAAAASAGRPLPGDPPVEAELGGRAVEREHFDPLAGQSQLDGPIGQWRCQRILASATSPLALLAGAIVAGTGSSHSVAGL